MRNFTKLIGRFSFVRKLLANFNGIAYGMMNGYVVNKEYGYALHICIERLHGKPKNVSNEWFWWSFFSNAVWLSEKLEKKENRIFLIDLAESNMGIDEGSLNHNVAKSIMRLSKWSFHEKDVDGMVRMARRASEVCPSWGEPYFILGWYGLFVPNIDSISYFEKAVELDRDVYLKKIASNKECRKEKSIMDWIGGDQNIDNR